ncbi:MAG TPA: uracil-DNA glycosylase family protein [Myxococcota bacterium]|nr:uracil-DNA glycosylase family protein [Myxococcota bacterium]
MTPAERREALRAIAARLDGIDREVYAAYGADPLEPVIGEGDPACRLAVFGRDPGRQEIEHRVPFIGAGGLKVRRALHEALYGRPSATLEEHLDAGRRVFWANTVPYKPIGNAAWPERVRREVRPIIADLLVGSWRGADVLALGKEALLWFADTPQERARLLAHWARPDAFGAPVQVTLRAGDAARDLTVHALPHPSPLNATWAPRFPGLIADRLRALGWGPSSWRLDGVVG